MKRNQLTIGRAIQFGFSQLYNHWAYFLGIFGIYFGVNYVFKYIGSLIDPTFPKKVVDLINTGLVKANLPMSFDILPNLMAKTCLPLITWYALYFVVSVVLWLGLRRICLNIYNNKSNTINTLFSQYALLPKGLFGGLIYILLLTGPALLGIIPGIGILLFSALALFLLITFMFYDILIVDKNLSVMDAFKESARLTKGYKLELFLLLVFSSLFPFIPVLIKRAVVLDTVVNKLFTEGITSIGMFVGLLAATYMYKKIQNRK